MKKEKTSPQEEKTGEGSGKTEDGKKKIPNMGDPAPVKAPKPKRRKRRKELKTPSFYVRICMIWTYVIIIFLIASPFVTASFYITKDLGVTTNVDEAYLYLSDQEQVDKAAKELKEAISGLEKRELKPEEVDDYQEGVVSLRTAMYEWQYHAAKDVDTVELLKLIEESKAVDRRLYTEESVKKLNQATMQGQKTLCATVTVTRSLVQLMFDGNVNGSDTSMIGGIITSIVLVFALAVLPITGFFISAFDKRRHIKNTFSLICSIACISIIFVMIYPFVAIGSVLSVFGYILLFVLSAAGFYTKQQEDYIVRHPEQEAEFGQKHPQFIKALINYKATLPVVTEAEKTYKSAQNAKKHGRSRK